MRNRSGFLIGICTVIMLIPAASPAIDVGGQIEEDTTWALSDSPINIVGEIWISDGATLTIESSVQVHLNHYALTSHWPGYTNGYLIADGVSFHGSSSPAENVFIRPDDHVEGCNFLSVRLVLNADGGVLQNCYFSTDLYGILVQGDWTIYNCTFEDCAYGIWQHVDTPVSIRNCNFSGCDEAFHFFDFQGFPEIEIRYCNFSAPGQGIVVDASPTTYFIDATQNFWGHASGPSHPDNPGGSGAQIGEGVLFEPWLSVQATPMTDVHDSTPAAGVTLHQNSPNPFNPLTHITFDLPQARDVKLVVFTLTGRKVATLLDMPLGPGHHDVTWTGRDDSGQEMASGTYIYRLEAGDHSTAKQMVLVR